MVLGHSDLQATGCKFMYICMLWWEGKLDYTTLFAETPRHRASGSQTHLLRRGIAKGVCRLRCELRISQAGLLAARPGPVRGQEGERRVVRERAAAGQAPGGPAEKLRAAGQPLYGLGGGRLRTCNATFR